MLSGGREGERLPGTDEKCDTGGVSRDEPLADHFTGPAFRRCCFKSLNHVRRIAHPKCRLRASAEAWLEDKRKWKMAVRRWAAFRHVNAAGPKLVRQGEFIVAAGDGWRRRAKQSAILL